MARQKVLQGWKMCCLKDGELHSYYPCSYNGTDDLVYSTKKWTFPKKGQGPLFLYADEMKKEAYNFMNRENFRLCRCEYVKSRSPIAWFTCKDSRVKSSPRDCGGILAARIRLLDEGSEGDK